MVLYVVQYIVTHNACEDNDNTEVNYVSMTKKTQEELDRWSKEVKRGAVTLAILALLSKRKAYGYEAVKLLDEKMSFLALEQGTVYPLLRRLEKRELLKSEWDYEDPTKPKKYYTVTEQGLKAVGAMTQTWNVLSREMRGVVMEVE
jgi:DNA-binding PadR family transcriptional regulator